MSNPTTISRHTLDNQPTSAPEPDERVVWEKPFTRHGGAYDRGSADAWYERPPAPHYYTGGTYATPRVYDTDMTVEEIAAYMAGYEEQNSLERFFGFLKKDIFEHAPNLARGSDFFDNLSELTHPQKERNKNAIHVVDVYHADK